MTTQNIFESPSQTIVPIGTIQIWYSLTVPQGYLVCNGATFDQYALSRLFVILGTNVVPDLRDKFIRGKSDARVIGNIQTESFGSHTHGAGSLVTNTVSQSHTHNTQFLKMSLEGSGIRIDLGGDDGGNNQNSPEYGYQYDPYVNGLLHTESTTLTHNHTLTGNTSASGDGTEVRPNNIAVVYIIKAQ